MRAKWSHGDSNPEYLDAIERVSQLAYGPYISSYLCGNIKWVLGAFVEPLAPVVMHAAGRGAEVLLFVQAL